jgi:hypothetical protein
MLRQMLVQVVLAGCLLSGAADITCGMDTVLRADDVCMCDSESHAKDNSVVRASERELQGTAVVSNSTAATNVVTIAGIYDQVSYDWVAFIFNTTISLINNQTDGWHDNIFADEDNHTIFVPSLRNEGLCNETLALKAYWDIRKQNGGVPVHGLVGCRCSGSSIAVACIAGLEEVPQISPSSTSGPPLLLPNSNARCVLAATSFETNFEQERSSWTKFGATRGEVDA